MSDTQQIVLSKEAVRKEWAAVLEAERQARVLRERFSLLAGYLRLTGNEDWVPVEAAAAIGPPKMGRTKAERGTWTSEIMILLEDRADGIETGDLKTALSEGPMSERAHSSPNAFYNALSKLESQGVVKKYKGRVFTTARLDDFLARVERGEVQDLAGRSGAGTIVDALADVVAMHPEGISPRDVVKAVESQGVAAGSVYNNLTKAMMKNRIRREGKLYFPPNEKGPPKGGPDTGEAPTSSNIG